MIDALSPLIQRSLAEDKTPKDENNSILHHLLILLPIASIKGLSLSSLFCLKKKKLITTPPDFHLWDICLNSTMLIFKPISR